jgi:hypothetical protein
MAQVVVGLPEALKLLEDAPQNVAILGFAKAGRAAINTVAAGLVERTPLGEGKTRGDLVRGLKVEVTVDTQGRGVKALTGFRGDEAEVALEVEYGHKLVTHAPEFHLIGHVPEHPFIRPCFDATANAAIDAFAATLETELKKVYG